MARKIHHLGEIVDEFDAFLVDQFGVLMTANGAISGASQSLVALKESGKSVYILSNSGKRSRDNIARLAKLGFLPESYDGVVTSGEVSRDWLIANLGKTIPMAARTYIIARDHDQSMIDGLNLTVTFDPSDAQLIMIAGSESDLYDMAHYQYLLVEPASRGVLALCTNPDRKMYTASGIGFGAGAIAEMYQQRGGRVKFIGKPHSEIYDTILGLLPNIEAGRILAIGDSYENDIVGAKRMKFSTLHVVGGVYVDQGIAQGADLAIDRFIW